MSAVLILSPLVHRMTCCTHRRNRKICCCKVPWCTPLLRNEHYCGDMFVRFPTNEEECRFWCTALSLEHDDLKKDSRVCLFHFHEIDFIRQESGDGKLAFDGVSKTEVTKMIGRGASTSANSEIRPPRPEAAFQAIQSSTLYPGKGRERTVINFNDYTVPGSIDRKRKKANPKSIITANTGRPLKKENLAYSFIGDADMLAGGFKSIIYHSKKCNGVINLLTSKFKRLGLGIQAILSCELGNNCTCVDGEWKDGVYVFRSAPPVTVTHDGKTRTVTTLEVKFATAMVVASPTPIITERIFTVMGLKPPSRPLSRLIVSCKVAPRIFDWQKKLENDKFDKMRQCKGVVLGADTGHTSARNSQGAQTSVSYEGEIVSTLSTYGGNAWQREGANMVLILDKLIDVEKIDVAGMTIDDNKSNAKLISSRHRDNAADDAVKHKKVSVFLDLFHLAKTLGNLLTKAFREASDKLAAVTKTLDSTVDKLTFLNALGKSLSEPFDDVTSPIQAVFDGLSVDTGSDDGASANASGSGSASASANASGSAWAVAIGSADSMSRFAQQHGLIDKADVNDYSQVISLYNGSVDVTKHIATIHDLPISTLKLEELKPLLAPLRAACGKPVLVSLPLLKDDWTKQCMSCMLLSFRGDTGNLFSVSLDEALKSATASMQTSEEGADASIADDRETRRLQAVRQCFGSTRPTASAVDKLVHAKLDVLVEFLRSDEVDLTHINLSHLTQKRALCKRELWRFGDEQADFEAALVIASSFVKNRIPDLKRLFKQSIRIVNEVYGSFSRVFKIYWVWNSLLNFSDHYSNNHKNCSCFFWYAQCALSTSGYVPSQPYLNEVMNNRGQRCNAFVKALVPIFIKAWLSNKQFTKKLFESILATKTSVNESFFHSAAIFSPKVYNVSRFQYILAMAAHFCIFTERQKTKVYSNRVLTTTKYCPLGVVSTAAKLPLEEQWIFDLVADICEDQHSRNQAAVMKAKSARRRDKRLAAVQLSRESASPDQQALNTALNLGVQSNGHQGFESGQSDISRTQLSVHRDSVFPRPLFPFPNEDLLQNSEQKALYQKMVQLTKTRKQARKKEKLQCAKCFNVINADYLRCSECDAVVHNEGDCSDGWVVDEESEHSKCFSCASAVEEDVT